jgi:hypothetical protein
VSVESHPLDIVAPVRRIVHRPLPAEAVAISAGLLPIGQVAPQEAGRAGQVHHVILLLGRTDADSGRPWARPAVSDLRELAGRQPRRTQRPFFSDWTGIRITS